MVVIEEKEVCAEPAKVKETEGITIERKVSHGIGGLGNYRRPSDVPYPPKSSPEKRHNSIWSKLAPSPGSSPTERRGSVMNIFRRNSLSESIAPLTNEADSNQTSEGS